MYVGQNSRYKWRIQNIHPYPVADHLALRELRELRGRSCAGLAGPTSIRGEAILGVEVFSITFPEEIERTISD